MKKHLYSIIYLFIILISISCTQDDVSNLESIDEETLEKLDQNTITSRTVHFNDLQNHKLIEQEVASFEKKFQNFSKSGRSSSQEAAIIINTNDVLVLESNISTSYIFQIVLPSTEANSNIVDNLVINDNGEVLEQYVTRYFLTGEEIDNIENIDYSTLKERTFFLDIDVDIESILNRNNRSTLYSCPPGNCCTSETSQGTGWTIYEVVPCNQSPTTTIGVDENDPYENGSGGTSASGNSNNNNPNNNDPYDDYDPQNGGIFSNGGGGSYSTGSENHPTNGDTVTGNQGSIITQIFWNGNLEESQLINNLNALLETPLTDEQEEWILESDENKELAELALEILENTEETLTFDEAIEKAKIKKICNDVGAQLSNPDYAERAAEINNDFNVEQEAGFEEKTDGTFDQMAPVGEHSVAYTPTATSKGYLHKHTNNRENGNIDADGNPEIVKTTKIFSPQDIVLFIRTLQAAHQAGNPVDEVYGTIYTSVRDYTLRFNGNPEEATLANFNENNPDVLNERYETLIREEGKEKGLLLFLQEQVGIEGIQLFRIKNDGTLQHKSLDENDRKQNTNCEDL